MRSALISLLLITLTVPATLSFAKGNEKEQDRLAEAPATCCRRSLAIPDGLPKDLLDRAIGRAGGGLFLDLGSDCRQLVGAYAGRGTLDLVREAARRSGIVATDGLAELQHETVDNEAAGTLGEPPLRRRPCLSGERSRPHPGCRRARWRPEPGC